MSLGSSHRPSTALRVVKAAQTIIMHDSSAVTGPDPETIELGRAEKTASAVASLMKVEEDIMKKLERCPTENKDAIQRRLETVQAMINQSLASAVADGVDGDVEGEESEN